jgi:hypothetical protein
MPALRRWVLNSVATLAVAALMTRAVFATDKGSRIARLVPNSFWEWLDARLAVSDQEQAYDAQFAVFGVASLLLAALLVALVRVVIRRARRALTPPRPDRRA